MKINGNEVKVLEDTFTLTFIDADGNNQTDEVTRPNRVTPAFIQDAVQGFGAFTVAEVVATRRRYCSLTKGFNHRSGDFTMWSKFKLKGDRWVRDSSKTVNGMY